jgi:transposase
MRVGQKNGIVRQWARTGSRPRQPKDQRYESAYLFGAICPAKGTGAALVMPDANTQAMQAHLAEIGRTVARGAHAVLLLDRAGWHTSSRLTIPRNITLLYLPARSPELNPVENVWQYLRQNHLSNRVFPSYETILEASCEAWNRLLEKPWKVMSIGLRQWAYEGQTQ